MQLQARNVCDLALNLKVLCGFHTILALRIIRISDGSQPFSPGHKSSVGRGGYRIDASRNLWDGSGLKIDSASTDVAWGHGGVSFLPRL